MKYFTSLFFGCVTAFMGHAETVIPNLETRPLSLKSITATDYIDLIKLLTPISMQLKEVQALKAKGLIIGIVAGKDEIMSLGSFIDSLDVNYIIRPDYVIKSTGGVWEKKSSRPMCLVSLSIESIAPPYAKAYVYVITGPDEKDTQSVELSAVKTRSGWIMVEPRG